MENVSAEALGMDEDVFNVAVLKLENERFITGAVFKYRPVGLSYICLNAQGNANRENNR